jgi:hypothetical protein
MKSGNRKTGDMVQTWILSDDYMTPVQASQNAADAAVCGDCKHRWSLGGACYVNLGQGPGAVFRAYKAGKYHDAAGTDSRGDDARRAIGNGRKVRLGAYGDPAAVPVAVWRELVALADGHTGYTHQWKIAPALRTLCMASVDTDAEFVAARAMGWRTFRVASDLDALQSREFECAATAKEGTTCADCMACDGAGERGTAQASVAIVVHGSLASRFARTVQA